MDHHDYIIIGGGSAGCVLAHRLSADPRKSVLLIEAGIDTPPGRVPDDIFDSYPTRAYFNPRYRWTELKVYLQSVPHNAPEQPPLRQYEQARVMGGGSSINGQVAYRGAPADYDEWERLGAKGWAWDKVLPYFIRLERDLDFDGPLHGKEGPLPIRRIFPELWSGFAKAASESYGLKGIPFREDLNAEFMQAHGPIPISNAYDRRMSTAIAYLDPMTRMRPNLRIMAETQVETLLFAGTRCVGVRATGPGGVQELRGGEVIVSAGAIHSPAILMRAGIGPVDHLRDLSIPVVADVPGVGRNLHEHPTISVSGYLPPAARLDPTVSRHIQVGARFSSGHPGCPPGDMALSTITRAAWHPLGKRLGTIQLWVNKSYSTGVVRLCNADWRREPHVAFNLATDPRDRKRLVDGMRFLASVFDQPPLKACALDPFPTAWSDRAKKASEVSAKNYVLTGILARLLDGPAPLRRFLVRTLITQGDTLAGLLADESAIEAYVMRTVTGNWHASCTCKMGSLDDPLTVVDPAGRVRGVEGLRVCDASVMPSITCANTNLPTIMIAEKMSDAILAG